MRACRLSPDRSSESTTAKRVVEENTLILAVTQIVIYFLRCRHRATVNKEACRLGKKEWNVL